MIAAKVRFVMATAVAVAVAGFGVWSVAIGGGQEGKPADAPPSKTIEPVLKSMAAEEPNAQKTTPAEEDLAAMQGEWIVGERYLDENVYLPQEVVNAVQEYSRKRGAVLTVQGDKLTWPVGRKEDRVLTEEYTIHLDPSASPKRINLIDANGKTRLGIYKFEGSYLHFCLTDRTTKDRPAGFVIKVGKVGYTPGDFRYVWRVPAVTPVIPRDDQTEDGRSIPRDSAAKPLPVPVARRDWSGVHDKLATIRRELAEAEKELDMQAGFPTDATELGHTIAQLRVRIDGAESLFTKARGEYHRILSVPLKPQP